MRTRSEALVAAAGVFAGSLMSDATFGDGIQSDDMLQAVAVAAIAAVIQLWLAHRRQR